MTISELGDFHSQVSSKAEPASRSVPSGRTREVAALSQAEDSPREATGEAVIFLKGGSCSICLDHFPKGVLLLKFFWCFYPQIFFGKSAKTSGSSSPHVEVSEDDSSSSDFLEIKPKAAAKAKAKAKVEAKPKAMPASYLAAVSWLQKLMYK